VVSKDILTPVTSMAGWIFDLVFQKRSGLIQWRMRTRSVFLPGILSILIKFRWTVLADLRLSVMCLFMDFKPSLLFKHASTLATFKHHSYLYSMKRDIHLSEFGNYDVHTTFYYCLSLSGHMLFFS
jgi:hypothetical protein